MPPHPYRACIQIIHAGNSMIFIECVENIIIKRNSNLDNWIREDTVMEILFWFIF
jgi:hypothetical protein